MGLLYCVKSRMSQNMDRALHKDSTNSKKWRYYDNNSSIFTTKRKMNSRQFGESVKKIGLPCPFEVQMNLMGTSIFWYL